jgi:hypothetical protein
VTGFWARRPPAMETANARRPRLAPVYRATNVQLPCRSRLSRETFRKLRRDLRRIRPVRCLARRLQHPYRRLLRDAADRRSCVIDPSGDGGFDRRTKLGCQTNRPTMRFKKPPPRS